MTGKALRAVLARLDITHARFARIVERDETTVRRWLRSPAVPGLIRAVASALAEGRITVEDLEGPAS